MTHSRQAVGFGGDMDKIIIWKVSQAIKKGFKESSAKWKGEISRVRINNMCET